MALAFKREQKVLEEGGLKDAQDNIVRDIGWAIPIEVDYESIKQIPGEAEWNSGTKEPNNILALRYINDQMKYVYILISDIGKDDVGKEALKTIKKIRLNVTPNGKPGIDMREVSTFDLSLKDGVLVITANLDYTQFIGQSFPYSELAKIVEKNLESSTNLLFKRQRIEFENGNLPYYQSRLDSSLGKSFKVEFDYTETLALKGTFEASQGNPEPRSAVAVRYLQEYAWYGVVSALETIGKDDEGKEALFETFEKFVIHVGDKAPKGVADAGDIKAHQYEKRGKVGHIFVNLPFDSGSYPLQNFPASDLASLIEKTL